MAMARRGMRVLVCESGLPDARRLAGELMHPPAADGLRELGVLGALREAGGVPTYGFAVFRGPDDTGTLLSYTEAGAAPGFAVDHALLTRTLLSSAARRPGIEVREGARVVGVSPGPDRVQVEIADSQGRSTVQTELVVSADGSRSRLRKRFGVPTVSGGRAIRMVGWKVPARRLPHPGHGHLFTGGPTVVLAYAISSGEARVMFELPDDPGATVSAPLLSALPAGFRQDVQAAMAEGPGSAARVVPTAPGRAAIGRLALVGDAGGCAHPLTATGISFCVRDALDLASRLERGGGSDVPARLRRYDADRAAALRTRLALAEGLVEAMSSAAPEARALRAGLFDYWTHSSAGRRASIALLATRESRPAVLAREYARVSYHALRGLAEGAVPAAEVPGALLGLARRNVEHARRVFGPRRPGAGERSGPAPS